MLKQIRSYTHKHNYIPMIILHTTTIKVDTYIRTYIVTYKSYIQFIHTIRAYIQVIHTLSYIQIIHRIHTYSSYRKFIHTIHSYTLNSFNSFIQSLTHSSIHSLTHPFIHSFPCFPRVFIERCQDEASAGALR